VSEHQAKQYRLTVKEAQGVLHQKDPESKRISFDSESLYGINRISPRNQGLWSQYSTAGPVCGRTGQVRVMSRLEILR
jgi:hypothetical protein